MEENQVIEAVDYVSGRSLADTPPVLIAKRIVRFDIVSLRPIGQSARNEVVLMRNQPSGF